MKKLFLWSFVLLNLLNVNSVFAIKEDKIIRVGYVDYTKIVQKATQDGKSLQAIDSLKESYYNQIQALETQVANLTANLQNNNAQESNVINQISQLDEKKIELNILKAKATTDISQQTEKLLGTLKERINAIIAQKAKQLGFDMIFDSSIVMVGSQSLDITNIVLASL